MKLTKFFLCVFATAIIVTAGCKKEEVIPVAVFDNLAYELSETSTSDLQVKVKLYQAAESSFSINFSVSGDAVEGVHYESITNKSISFAAGSSEAVIFIKPINVSLIESDRTITISLSAGNGFEIDPQKSVATITIKDNASPMIDAAEVAFTTSSKIVNAYLEEKIQVEVGLSKTLSSNLLIPLTFTGTANTTNYQTEGLTANNEISVEAGSLTALFYVTIKYTGEIDIDKTLKIEFASPKVTDYSFKSESSAISINIIDPTVENIWFLNRTNYADRSGNEAVVLAVDAAGNRAYDENNKPLPSVVAEGIYNPYIRRDKGDNKWGTVGNNYVYADANNPNMWKADWRFFYRSDSPASDTDYPYWSAYISCPHDFDILFANESTIIGYSSAGALTAKLLRLVATDKEAKQGIVIIPEQTLVAYKAKSGYDWKGKTTVDATFGDQYNYKIDSNDTKADITKSQNVTAVDIKIKGQGTYNISTKTIDYEVAFECSDPNFTTAKHHIRIYPLSADKQE